MTSRHVARGILAVGLTVGVSLAMSQNLSAQQATPPVAPAANVEQGGRGGGRGAVDPRVQLQLRRLVWHPPGPPRAGGAGAGRGGRGGGRGPTARGTAITDMPKTREASQKDVVTVLDMIRKEFSVDERRIYLMGHSMGGAGTYYLGSKYPNIWAAVAPIAPAAMGMTNDRVKVLQAIKDGGVPMLVSMGDADEAVPVANVRLMPRPRPCARAMLSAVDRLSRLHDAVGARPSARPVTGVRRWLETR